MRNHNAKKSGLRLLVESMAKGMSTGRVRESTPAENDDVWDVIEDVIDNLENVGSPTYDEWEPDGDGGIVLRFYDVPWCNGCNATWEQPGEPAGFDPDYIAEIKASVERDMSRIADELAKRGVHIEWYIDGFDESVLRQENEPRSPVEGGHTGLDVNVRLKIPSVDRVEEDAEAEGGTFVIPAGTPIHVD